MKPVHLLAANAVMAAVLILAAAEAADAQGMPSAGGPRIMLPNRDRMHGSHGGFFVVEREVIVIERKVEPDDKPAEPPASPPAPAAPPREPYVVGKTYASLPGGCMKLIDAGVSYYKCGGEWYRQTGSQYKAVSPP